MKGCMCGIVNERLCLVSEDKLSELGFIKHDDGTGGWGIDWNMETSKFRLIIDPCRVVKLAHTDSDFITLHIDGLHDLQMAVDFIQDV